VYTGTEMKNFRPHPALSLPGIQRAHPSRTNWRQQHSELISALRNARATKRAMDTGRPLPPPLPPSSNPDYIQCPYCSRRFNEKAAERHIPFCKVVYVFLLYRIQKLLFRSVKSLNGNIVPPASYKACMGGA